MTKTGYICLEERIAEIAMKKFEEMGLKPDEAVIDRKDNTIVWFDWTDGFDKAWEWLKSVEDTASMGWLVVWEDIFGENFGRCGNEAGKEEFGRRFKVDITAKIVA